MLAAEPGYLRRFARRAAIVVKASELEAWEKDLAQAGARGGVVTARHGSRIPSPTGRWCKIELGDRPSASC